MKKTVFIFYFLIFMSSTTVAQEIIELYVGEVKILNVGDINRIAVGNANLISTSMLDNGQLLLIAEGSGDSSLHIWHNDGTEENFVIHVNEYYGRLSKKMEEIKTLLEDVSGLKIRIVGERIALSGRIGEVHAPAITAVMTVFPDIIDLTQKDVLDLPDTKMVFMDVKITEFNKNYLETLGINWGTSISGPAAAFALNTRVNTETVFPAGASAILAGNSPKIAESALGYFGIATEITSRINFAVNSGNGVILAEPRLATRSGGEASFLAGGEIPFEITSLSGSTIEFKEFGVSLTIAPIVDQNNNILAHVATEVSAVDNSVSVGGVPGFLSRKTATDISMKSGETLVMSGLINQQFSKDISGIKFLSEIPILGELFKSKTFRDNRSELVIFVTPTVYDAESDINLQELERRRQGLQKTIEAINEKSLDIVD